jgi:hypothetical protein
MQHRHLTTPQKLHLWKRQRPQKQHLEHSQVLNHNNQVMRMTVETKTNHLTTVVVLHRPMT